VKISAERSMDIVKLRIGAPRKTLQEIGDLYGMTRERIRQILRDAEVDAETRAAISRAAIREKVVRIRPLKPGTFAKYVKKWIANTGYGYCTFGKHVIEGPHQPACRECNTRRAKEYRHADPGAAAMRARKQRQLHPETHRRAERNYQVAHPEKRRDYRRARYASDAAFREKMRERCRKAAAERLKRIKANPRLLEEYKAKQRERYQRQKIARKGGSK
jgi:hypothetical protein